MVELTEVLEDETAAVFVAGLEGEEEETIMIFLIVQLLLIGATAVSFPLEEYLEANANNSAVIRHCLRDG
jgi:hypothetical protein